MITFTFTFDSHLNHMKHKLQHNIFRQQNMKKKKMKYYFQYQKNLLFLYNYIFNILSKDYRMKLFEFLSPIEPSLEIGNINRSPVETLQYYAASLN
jgi:hypothetical protein